MDAPLLLPAHISLKTVAGNFCALKAKLTSMLLASDISAKTLHGNFYSLFEKLWLYLI